jgi:hypothetical protein
MNDKLGIYGHVTLTRSRYFEERKWDERTHKNI